jgi:putative membrane protein
VIRLLVSTALHLAANAIGLLVATLALDDMTIDATSFVFAVLIFTVVEVLAGPLLQKIALKNVQALMGSVALITTFVGLVITAIVSDGLRITGVWTWVLATIIVWLAGLLAGLILPVIFVKKAVDNRQA